MLLKDEKAKHLLFQVDSQVGAELPGVVAWLDKGCDLEKLPGSIWHCLLHTAQFLATAECIACLFWGMLVGRGFKMWKE